MSHDRAIKATCISRLNSISINSKQFSRAARALVQGIIYTMQTPLLSAPIAANYSSDRLTIGAGVAIFHVRTKRVVVCYHTLEKYWFLPKGRKNANESITTAAEREGFEETGYRNRLLPIPIIHKQTDPDAGHEPFVTEAVWVQLLPLSAIKQYLLFWYIAETVPQDVELSYDREVGQDSQTALPSRVYVPPPPFPKRQTLQQRIDEDTLIAEDGTRKTYEPKWHEGTGVNEDESYYRSLLLTVDDACKKLGRGVMRDVVRKGWEAIQLRQTVESGSEITSP
jgi:ADP-ribose pyrophosphatase YjhB (NUDIX family)